LVAGPFLLTASARGLLYVLTPDGKIAERLHLGARVIGPDNRGFMNLTGMNAGDGVVAVAASNRLVVFR
jgi:hypothetical protein